MKIMITSQTGPVTLRHAYFTAEISGAYDLEDDALLGQLRAAIGKKADVSLSVFETETVVIKSKHRLEHGDEESEDFVKNVLYRLMSLGYVIEEV